MDLGDIHALLRTILRHCKAGASANRKFSHFVEASKIRASKDNLEFPNVANNAKFVKKGFGISFNLLMSIKLGRSSLKNIGI